MQLHVEYLLFFLHHTHSHVPARESKRANTRVKEKGGRKKSIQTKCECCTLCFGCGRSVIQLLTAFFSLFFAEINYLILYLLFLCALVYDYGHVFSCFWAVMMCARERAIQANRFRIFMCRNRGKPKNSIKAKFPLLFTFSLLHIAIPVRRSIWSLSCTNEDEQECHWYRVWMGNDRKSLINVLQDWQPARLCFFL